MALRLRLTILTSDATFRLCRQSKTTMRAYTTAHTFGYAYKHNRAAKTVNFDIRQVACKVDNCTVLSHTRQSLPLGHACKVISVHVLH